MSQDILTALNFDDINLAQRTELGADVSIGDGEFTVKNPDGIPDNGFFVIDIPGKETAELGRIVTVVGNVVDIVDTIKRDHRRNELVSIIRYDAIRFYKAANVDDEEPNDEDYTEIDTVPITPDTLQTEFVNPVGGSGFWYKYTYVNSITDVETSLADAIAVRGGNYGNYVSVYEVRREAGLESNQNITDELIYEKLLAAEGEANDALAQGGVTLPLENVPETIKQAVRFIAAGLLLIKDYGPGNEGMNADGNDKLEKGRAMLARVANKSTTITVNGEVVNVGTGVRGYPMNDEKETRVTRERWFTRDSEF